MKIFERDLAPTGLAFDFDNRAEHDERHAEIRRMRRDAMLAPAQHRVQAVFALPRIAARAWLAPIAGARDIIKIIAPRPLQQVAADSGDVADLPRRAGKQGFGGGRIVSRKVHVVREVGVAYEGADAQTAVGKALDPVEARQSPNVDKT